MFALASLILYVLAIFLAFIFVSLLVVAPGTALNAPDATWETDKKWVRDTAMLYSIPIFSILVMSGLLLYSGGTFDRMVAYIGGFLTVLISFFVDRRRKSLPGMILDASIGICIIMSSLLYFIS